MENGDRSGQRGVSLFRDPRLTHRGEGTAAAQDGGRPFTATSSPCLLAAADTEVDSGVRKRGRTFLELG